MCLCLVRVDAQREWVRVQERLLRVQVVEVKKAPASKWRKQCFDIVQDARFERAILFAIIGNTVRLAC